MPFKSAFSIYSCFTSLIRVKLVTLILQSPLLDLIFNAYMVSTIYAPYIKLLLCRGIFAFHLLILEILIVIHRFIYACNWYSIVDAILVNNSGQGVLRHLETTCHDQSLSSVGILSTSIPYQYPYLRRTWGSSFYIQTMLQQYKITYPKTLSSIYQFHSLSWGFHKLVSFWCPLH